jgi:sec-independent protein translocase protein TatA
VPFGISPVELLIVLVIVLLLFGAKRLPEIGRGLGSSIREFRGGLSNEPKRDALNDGTNVGDGVDLDPKAPVKEPSADRDA